MAATTQTAKHKDRELNAVFISDLHFGVNRLSPTRMGADLLAWLAPRLTKNTDLLVISGDVYDHQLDADSPGAKMVNRVMTYILSTCAKFNIEVILLLGTTNHDGKQPENMVHINQGLDTPAKLHYWDKVGVHRVLGMDILAVPDNMANSAEGVWQLVQAAMKEAGVDKVHMAVTHGTYSIHDIAKFDSHAHDITKYLDIVNMLMVNGHVHQPKHYKWHITVGSFDRHVHGDEAAKGGWVVKLWPERGEYEATYHPNENAHCFKIVAIPDEVEHQDKAYELAVDAINEITLNNRPPFFVSLRHKKGFDIRPVVDRLKVNFPTDVHFTVQANKTTEPEVLTSAVILPDVKRKPPLTINTLPERFRMRLEAHDVEQIDYILDVFTEVLNEPL